MTGTWRFIFNWQWKSVTIAFATLSEFRYMRFSGFHCLLPCMPHGAQVLGLVCNTRTISTLSSLVLRASLAEWGLLGCADAHGGPVMHASLSQYSALAMFGDAKPHRATGSPSHSDTSAHLLMSKLPLMAATTWPQGGRGTPPRSWEQPLRKYIQC